MRDIYFAAWSGEEIGMFGSKHFVAALRESSLAPVGYAEIPGANHAFDALDSLRTHYVISGVQRFLESIRVTSDRA